MPSRAAPWDTLRVVHLHRRAGFAAIHAEIERDLEAEPEAAIDRLLHPGAACAERRDLATRLARAAVSASSLLRLQAAWIYRMLFGGDPLGERLTLFWHDWFATSERKVRDLAGMQAQNETFRRLGRGRFGDLLQAMLRDPALLEWLDARTNTKDRPNENLARELMELFTIGAGQFGEADVREVARALTGWASGNGPAVEKPADHDDGVKTVLGSSGKFRAPDVAALLLAHPATARRLADGLVRHFIGDDVVPRPAVESLAADLRSNDLDIGRAVATILRSEHFFAAAGRRNRVVGPVEYLVGTIRVLESPASRINTAEVAKRLVKVGQELFRPPNVAGWPSGRAQLSTLFMAARMTFALDVVEGRLAKDGAPADIGSLVRQRSEARAAGVIEALSMVLRGDVPGADEAAWLAASGAGGAADDAAALRRSAALVIASPWSQVC